MQRTCNRYVGSGVSAAMMLATAAAPALNAQEPPQRADAQLEEIVVTAERRATNIQSTPMSITALTGESLERAGVRDASDLMFHVPNLTMAHDSGVGIVTIRGIGNSFLNVGSDPSSTIHYDGAYVPRATALLNEMLDIERVEVLRGPQGTLYGRNAVGGTINLISKAPVETPEFALSAEYGSFGTTRFTTVMNGPLGSEAVLGRLALLKTDTDGSLDNVYTGKDFGANDSFAGRGSILIDASDDVEIVFRADFNRERGDGLPFKPVDVDQEIIDRGGIAAPGPRDVSLDAPAFRDTDQIGGSAIVTWDLGSLEFKSITGYRNSDTEFLVDLDVTNLPAVISVFDEESDMLTQEFQLSSNQEARYSWVGGLYYLREEADFDFTLLLNPDDDPRVDGLEDHTTQANIESNTTDAYAAFGQAIYSLTDMVDVTLGARYSYESKRNLSRTGVGLDREDIVFDRLLDEESWDAFTPKAVISYSPTGDAYLYASVARGFKSGGYNLRLDEDLARFDPEFLWNYEVGAKTSWLENRLRANTAVFWADYTDQQIFVSVALPNGTTQTFTENAGKSRLWGFEFEGQAILMPGLEINATLSYLDNEFRDFPDGTINRRGQKVPGTPEWTWNIGAQYERPLSGLYTLALRGDVQWRDDNRQNFEGSDPIVIDAYTLVNARVTLANANGWQVSVFGTNLTDEDYFVNLGGSCCAAQRGFLGKPRVIGARVAYEY